MKRRQIIAAGIAAFTMMSIQAAPTAAQRYCQNELADDNATDEGCTAPVGGPVKSGDPRFSSRASSADSRSDEQSDAAKLIEAALAGQQPN